LLDATGRAAIRFPAGFAGVAAPAAWRRSARAGPRVFPARSSSSIALPSSAGDFTVRTPAASKAAYLSAAVP
jgi:hypothetical protein